MKILLVHNTHQQPGGEDVVFEQECQLLERGGHQVLTFCRSNYEIKDSSLVERILLAKRTIWASDTRRDFLDLVRREQPALVHVHNTFAKMSPSIYSACREAHVPVVQTLHNYRLHCPVGTFYRKGHVCEECRESSLWRGVRYGCYRDSRAATAAVAMMLATHRTLGTWTRHVDSYIAPTEFARQKCIAGGIPGSKISVKPNFVHPDPALGHRTGYGALFVGRLSPEKGLATLLRAWERLRPPVPIRIVGDGPLRRELELRATERNLSSVQFMGHKCRDDVIAAIKRAQFLIFPSLWYETFGMTIIEAFACGVPVICSRLGAMEEIVSDRRTGLHFNPGDEEDLAKTVEWAWTHPEQMAEMGRAARREYETKYTAEINYQNLMEIYRRVMDARGVAQEAHLGRVRRLPSPSG